MSSGGAFRVGELDVEERDSSNTPVSTSSSSSSSRLRPRLPSRRARRGEELLLRVLVEPPHERVGGRRVERPPVLLRRPRRGCPRRSSGRRGALSGSGRSCSSASASTACWQWSLIPARPSSPQRYARDLARSSGKKSHASHAAVVLAHRAPLTRAGDIGAPAAPQRHPVPIFVETLLFGVIDHGSAQSTKDPPSLPG